MMKNKTINLPSRLIVLFFIFFIVQKVMISICEYCKIEEGRREKGVSS